MGEDKFLYPPDDESQPVSLHRKTLIAFLSCLNAANLMTHLAKLARRNICVLLVVVVVMDERRKLRKVKSSRRKPSRMPVSFVHTGLLYILLIYIYSLGWWLACG